MLNETCAGFQMDDTPIPDYYTLYLALKTAAFEAWPFTDIAATLFETDPTLSRPEHATLRAALIGAQRRRATGPSGLYWPSTANEGPVVMPSGQLFMDGMQYHPIGRFDNKTVTTSDKAIAVKPSTRNHGDNEGFWVSKDKVPTEFFCWKGIAYQLTQKHCPKPQAALCDKDSALNIGNHDNILIEGDNVVALALLQPTYTGKVDVMYIDPPYNTGTRGFRYQDRFSAGHENGIHAKWLSFMEARLRQAYLLLSTTGTICISIDDNEYAPLKLLCDMVFGCENYLATIIWKKKNTPPNDKVLGAVHEYILIYAKDKNAVHLDRRERSQEQTSRYKNPDNHAKGPWAAGDLTANVKGGRYVAHLHYPITNPRTGQMHYPGQNGNWRFNQERMAQLLQNDEIYFGADDRGKPKLKRFLCDVKAGVAYSTLWDAVGFNSDATRELQRYFTDALTFDTPKPVNLIMELLRLTTRSKPDALVMDFFAGSGTTGEAVMALNAELGGNRRFVLITNNENQICEAVCYPRLREAILRQQYAWGLRYQKVVYTLAASR